jgi:hypothetical protein
MIDANKIQETGLLEGQNSALGSVSVAEDWLRGFWQATR